MDEVEELKKEITKLKKEKYQEQFHLVTKKLMAKIYYDL